MRKTSKKLFHIAKYFMIEFVKENPECSHSDFASIFSDWKNTIFFEALSSLTIERIVVAKESSDGWNYILNKDADDGLEIEVGAD